MGGGPGRERLSLQVWRGHFHVLAIWGSQIILLDCSVDGDSRVDDLRCLRLGRQTAIVQHSKTRSLHEEIPMTQSQLEKTLSAGTQSTRVKLEDEGYH